MLTWTLKQFCYHVFVVWIFLFAQNKVHERINWTKEAHFFIPDYLCTWLQSISFDNQWMPLYYMYLTYLSHYTNLCCATSLILASSKFFPLGRWKLARTARQQQQMLEKKICSRKKKFFMKKGGFSLQRSSFPDKLGLRGMERIAKEICSLCIFNFA